MVITLNPELETVLNDTARQQGITPEALAIDILREQLLGTSRTIQPRDEWERRLLGAAVDCGRSLTNQVLSSEGLYE
jgi:hypothetical protein